MLSLCVLFLAVELEDVLQLMLAKTLYLESLLNHHLSLVHLLLHLAVLLGLEGFVSLSLLCQHLALMELHVFLDATVSIAFDSSKTQTRGMGAFDSFCILHKRRRVFSLFVISALWRMLLLFDLGLLHIRVTLCQLSFVLPYQFADITQNGYDSFQVLLKSLVLVLVQCCNLHTAEAKQRLDTVIDITILQADHLPQEILNLQRFEFRSRLVSLQLSLVTDRLSPL